MNWWVPLFVIVPLGGAFITAIIGSFSQAFGRYFTSLLLAALTGFALFIMFTPIGTMVYRVGGHELFDKIPIAIYMVMDGLSLYLLVIINLIGFLSAFYSISYIKTFTSENYYYPDDGTGGNPGGAPNRAGLHAEHVSRIAAVNAGVLATNASSCVWCHPGGGHSGDEGGASPEPAEIHDGTASDFMDIGGDTDTDSAGTSVNCSNINCHYQASPWWE